MEVSEEVREATLEMVRCVMEGDADGWQRLWSSRDGVTSIGSDPREQLERSRSCSPTSKARRD